MKSINHYIVHVPNKLEHTWNTKSDVTIYRPVVASNGHDAYRTGAIVCDCEEDDLGVREGDEVAFHHNVTYESLDHEGNEMKSDSMIDEKKKLYVLDRSEIYGYKREGKFYAVNGFIFVKPIIDGGEEVLPSGIILPHPKVERKIEGEVVFSNNSMRDKGVYEGSTVYFEDEDCKYPMNIDGTTLWRMRDEWIMGISSEV